jgi:2-keto-4-pentenoate hydratase/2-oxohepta-3-ene-1,7-dioic acid hydratase in catechol pathway
MSAGVVTVAGPEGPNLLLLDGGHLYDVRELARTSGVPDDLVGGDLGDLFRAGSVAVDALRSLAPGRSGATPVGTIEDDLPFLPPVTRPTKVICVGLNYRLHAQEGGVAVPTRPVLFAKFPNTLTGHRTAIVYPRITRELDYEGELAVIIGRRCSRVSVEDALDYVGAYTILDDVSARDLQSSEPQWIRGKSLDGFAPVGPVAVLPEPGFDPSTYRIRTTVSGELRQDAACSDMVFSVAEIIAFISEGITLEPGDIVSTGTPPGVGLGFDPPRYLSPGDTIRIEIEGIGALENTVVAA